jgi:hypothetical protein
MRISAKNEKTFTGMVVVRNNKKAERKPTKDAGNRGDAILKEAGAKGITFEAYLEAGGGMARLNHLEKWGCLEMRPAGKAKPKKARKAKAEAPAAEVAPVEAPTE